MRELRLVAVSDDGSHLVVRSNEPDGEQFRLPLDERLRAAVRRDVPRLSQLEIRRESSLTPREIQARLRAGESPEDVAQAAGVPVERVTRFEGPVLAERLVLGAARRPGRLFPRSAAGRSRVGVVGRLPWRVRDLSVSALLSGGAG